MAIVQKTIEVNVLITVEVDEAEQDFYQAADSVRYGLQAMDDAGELFVGGTVKEYSTQFVEVKETNYQYN